MQNFLVGKCLKISQKLHGGDRKHIQIHKANKERNKQKKKKKTTNLKIDR